MRVAIADCVFDIKAKYDYMKDFMKEYIVDDNEELKFNIPKLKVSEEEIEYEQEGYEERFDRGYLETLAILRKLSEYLSLQNVILFHGVAMTYKEQCYIISAKSGTGKSTHAALWKKYVTDGQVDIINGDKPFIRMEEDTFTVYGTPWCGKEGYHINKKAPLAGIIFIERGTDNVIEKADERFAVEQLFRQIHMTNQGAANVLGVCDRIIKKVPIYRLSCDMSRKAVEVSFKGVTNNTL